jgi:hypothetical protein
MLGKVEKLCPLLPSVKVHYPLLVCSALFVNGSLYEGEDGFSAQFVSGVHAETEVRADDEPAAIEPTPMTVEKAGLAEFILAFNPYEAAVVSGMR